MTSFVFQFADQNYIKVKMYGTIILPFVLYGCATWFLSLREERGLRVFENRVLRKIFVPKRNAVTREWRRLHNGEHNELNCVVGSTMN